MNCIKLSDVRRMPRPWANPRRKAAIWLAGCCFLLAALDAHAGPSVTEYQVKAVFLLNFAKYVDWPAEAFATATTPIVIGVLGEDNFKGDLEGAVKGRSIGGRTIVTRHVTADDEVDSCHILFISSSERLRLGEILGKTKTLPILTVGECDQFTEKGGIINFTLKEGKVRLEIELNAARQSRLRISSRLLSVADVVIGKAK